MCLSVLLTLLCYWNSPHDLLLCHHGWSYRSLLRGKQTRRRLESEVLDQVRLIRSLGGAIPSGRTWTRHRPVEGGDQEKLHLELGNRRRRWGSRLRVTLDASFRSSAVY